MQETHENRKTNVLIVGSGGREHALMWKIAQSPFVDRLFVAPGNGGTIKNNIRIQVDDLEGLAKFALDHECFTIVGPELPISLGIVDFFQSKKLDIFGPTKEQARMETSKSFSKEFMKKNDIPTSEFEVFADPANAINYAISKKGKVAVKADGLASGKGVYVCSSAEDSSKAIRAIMEGRIFGNAGNKIVIEERLFGPELSFFALCDGRRATYFGNAVDHKRLLEGDEGPNTGGMGAYSPALEWDNKDTDQIMQTVVKPIVENTGFKGFLFVGLILTKDGPKVLEFNCRMGDPETQCLMPRLETDLLSLLLQSDEGSIPEGREGSISFSQKFSCCVVMCSGGYPSKYESNLKIEGVERASMLSNLLVFHSGTRFESDLLTSSGRVLGVTGTGLTLGEAEKIAYEGVRMISWAGEYHRKDIGSQVHDNRLQSALSGKCDSDNC